MLDPGLIIGGSRRIHPLILVAIPLTALALTTRRELHRTEGAPPLQRIGWALAVAAPFGLWMLVFAIIGGNSATTNIDVSAGNAFALGILWGLVGGFIGAVTKIPLGTAIKAVPAPAQTALTAVQTTLRPLAALLITCTAIALVGWLVQVGADVGDVRAGRSAPTALIEEAAFAAEHGIHLTALAAGARFRADANGALGLPFPVERAERRPRRRRHVPDLRLQRRAARVRAAAGAVILIGPGDPRRALRRLHRRPLGRRATLPIAAAWGAITGPAWAIAMTLLALLAGGLFHGDADDASVFGVFLLGGALLGAAGGALSASGQSSGGEATGDSPAPPVSAD